MSDETLIYQLKDDLQALFADDADYSDLKVKTAYDGDDEITYPLCVIEELDNYDNNRYYDGEEHIINVGYQFDILCDQTIDYSAEKNVRRIIEKIKIYMRGERYHALERIGSSPILTSKSDRNVKIGFMRYTGCIDKDTNTIYRRK